MRTANELKGLDVCMWVCGCWLSNQSLHHQR